MAGASRCPADGVPRRTVGAGHDQPPARRFERPQQIRHDGFLSRRSNIDLGDLRAAILESLKDIEPDLELEDWRVPSLRPASNSREDHGLRCPTCGELIFRSFQRIRPPPLNLRDTRPRRAPESSF